MMRRRGLHLCEAVGVMAAAAHAMGHRLLISGPAGSSHIICSTTTVDSLNQGASAAVFDGTFTAGPSSREHRAGLGAELGLGFARTHAMGTK